MIDIEREFDYGYVAPVGRGVHLWNGENRNREGPEVRLEELIYEALGEDFLRSSGYELEGITIKIAIEKAAQPG